MNPTYLSTSVGPFSVTYLGHYDAAAFDREAGELGACVREADASIAFRCTRLVFIDKFTSKLEELSGLTRQIDKKRTEAYKKTLTSDTSRVIYESFVTFANRAKATILLRPDGGQLWAEIEQEALDFSKTLHIDASPAKVQLPFNNSDLTKAVEWIEVGDKEFIETRVSKYSEYVGGFDLERTETGWPVPESLAKLIYAFLKKRNDEELNQD